MTTTQSAVFCSLVEAPYAERHVRWCVKICMFLGELHADFLRLQRRRRLLWSNLNLPILMPVPISKAEICKVLPDISVTTVEAVLGSMVQKGLIRRIGAGRASRYIRT